MAFNQLELKRIDKQVGEFCRKRVPVKIQSQLRYNYRVENQNVILYEERPKRDKSCEWLPLDFAKLSYIKQHNIWKLYWKRASGKWKLYEPKSEGRNLKVLIDTIREDWYGCFFG